LGGSKGPKKKNASKGRGGFQAAKNGGEGGVQQGGKF